VTLGGVAIDCGWLMTLAGKTFDEQFAAMQLVDRMCEQEVPLLLDHDGKIAAEYDRYFHHGSQGRMILTKLMKRSVSFAHGVPSARCVSALTADGFDPADLPYIGVAEHSSGAYLTHEEKHLESDRCSMCLADCGVIVCGSADVDRLVTV
jgi:hypothetical protein